MSVSTIGKIRGFVTAESIANFIKQNWDANVTFAVSKSFGDKVVNLKDTFEITPNSEDANNFYYYSGYISFVYNNEKRMIHYYYQNLIFPNKAKYFEDDIKEAFLTETTTLSIGCWGDSVEIIKELITQFGGGWIDENDCDDNDYYEVNSETTISNPSFMEERVLKFLYELYPEHKEMHELEIDYAIKTFQNIILGKTKPS